MFKRRLTIPEIYLLIINLVPILGVWFQGWDPARIFLFYCLETILVGIFHVIKMILIMLLSKTDAYESYKTKGILILACTFLICFFIMHYGIFVFVQTSMFFAVSGIYKGELFSLDMQTLKTLLGKEGMLMMAIFIIYYILDTIKQGTVFRIDKVSDIAKLMFQPYGRIFIQQFVLIFGSMFLAFKLGYVFIVIFVLVRIYVEFFMNLNKKMEDSVNEKLEDQNISWDEYIKKKR